MIEGIARVFESQIPYYCSPQASLVTYVFGTAWVLSSALVLWLFVRYLATGPVIDIAEAVESKPYFGYGIIKPC